MEVKFDTNNFDARSFERLADSKSGAKGTKEFDAKLYEKCEELEAFFLKTLISSMRKTVDKSELTKTGFAGEIYDDMLWDERSKSFSKKAKFGFANMLYKELTGEKGSMINQRI